MINEEPQRLSAYAERPILLLLGDSDVILLREHKDQTGKVWRLLRLAGGETIIVGSRRVLYRERDEGYQERLRAFGI